MTDPMDGPQARFGAPSQRQPDADLAESGAQASIGRRSKKKQERNKSDKVSDPDVSAFDSAGAANQDQISDQKRRRKRRRRRAPDTKGPLNESAQEFAAKETVAALNERDQPNIQNAAGKSGKKPRAEHLHKVAQTPGEKPEHVGTAAKKPRQQSERQGRAHPSHPPLYAALDLGTNNCRLLIAKPTKAGQFYVVDAFSRIVRLGEGLEKNGGLSQNAMDRAIEALKICAAKLDRQPIKKYRLIATEACRQADNGARFLERVKQETNLNLEIINRETEARLAVSGCASLIGQHANSVILFDIGGGSSEIALIKFDGKRSPRLSNHIVAWTSLPVGVVTLSERHGGKVVTQEIFDSMVGEVEQLITETAPDDLLNFEPDIENFHLLGTSGTVTTLAGLHLDLPRYDRRQVDGLWMKDGDVDTMLAKLLSWDIDKRSANPCIGPDRSDLVLAGCAIMQAIRKRWPSNRMRVADRGLREGLLNDMMARDGVWRRRRKQYRPKRRSRRKTEPKNDPTTQQTHQPKGNPS